VDVSGQGHAPALLKSAIIFKYYLTQNLRVILCVNEYKCCRVPRKELVLDVKSVYTLRI
jgi:hypothetical protein